MADLSRFIKQMAAGYAYPSDFGLLGWVSSPDAARDVSLLSVEGGAGVLKLTRFRRLPSSRVTNLHCMITAAGVGLTNSFAAFFKADGTLLGQTADQSAAWQSVGYKTMPLAAPVDIDGGDYYGGMWYNGTTAPQMLRIGLGSTGAQANLSLTSADYNAVLSNATLTTTAPNPFTVRSNSVLRWWMAIS